MLDFLKIAFLTDISHCFSNCRKNGAYQCNERHPVCVVDRGRAGMCVRGVCVCVSSLPITCVLSSTISQAFVGVNRLCTCTSR